MSSGDFITAALNGDLSRVHELIAGADQVCIKTALMNAAQQGHSDVVELLLAKGADINARLSNGYTPLTLACRGDHWDVAKVLILKEADVNLATNNGYTALIFAASEGELEIVEELIAKGADVNARTAVGTTALLLASVHKNVVEALIKAGASTGSSSDLASSSSTPAEQSESSGNDKVTETLVKAMNLLSQEQPVEAAECLLDLEAAGAGEQLTGLKRATAVALVNYAVEFSNKYLGQLNQEMSRNGWDGGYNLGEAQNSARNLKYKTISWLKMASVLDPSNSQISGLIDSYFKMHVTSLYDQEICKR